MNSCTAELSVLRWKRDSKECIHMKIRFHGFLLILLKLAALRRRLQFAIPVRSIAGGIGGAFGGDKFAQWVIDITDAED